MAETSSWVALPGGTMTSAPSASHQPKPTFDDSSPELSARRTGMSFQRTRMSADRTLMSVMRTAISLIAFGFTVYQFFDKLSKSGTLVRAGSHAPRNFGVSLLWLGIGMLSLGIVYHVQFMRGLRHERKAMRAEGLIHGESGFPMSLTLVTAVLLLALGLAVVFSIVFRVGPFA
jgi:putative membrane protein